MFEPSIRLATDNGLRDRLETGDFAGSLCPVRQWVRRPAARPRSDHVARSSATEPGLTRRRPHDAAEAQVRRRRVDGLPLSRRRAIAEAVAWCTQVRAALDHAARDRLSGAELGRRDARIARNAARTLDLSGRRALNQSDVHRQGGLDCPLGRVQPGRSNGDDRLFEH